MNPLIFVSLENWDDIWRRNQFICAELSRRHPDQKILFVGLPHNVSHSLRQGRLPQMRTDELQPLPNFPNIYFFRPVKWWPNSFVVGRKVNERSFRRQVCAAVRQLKIEKPLLWINDHAAVHLVGKIGESGVVYDITDDWTSLVQKPSLSSLIAVQDAELCRRAEATIVCSQKLYDMKQSLARRLFLVPNGVDDAHYEGVADGTGSPAPVTKSWSHPVLGYLGTVHPERVDVDLVAKVAAAFPHGTVALVGPDLLTEKDHEQLTKAGNVLLTGPVSYQQVPHILTAFDVLLVPHVETAFTESLNPIKLWEYLACGKPVVSTNVAGFRDFANLFQIASGAENFVQACQSALVEDSSRKAARLKVAKKNSWRHRVDKIEEILTSIS